MTGIEVLELPDHSSVALIKTTVKEKQHIADIVKNYSSRLSGFIRKCVEEQRRRGKYFTGSFL